MINRNYVTNNSAWKTICMDGIVFENYAISVQGQVRNKKTGKILNPSISSSGYERVALTKDGKKYQFSVHRLVAIHFIPIPKKYTDKGLGYKDLVPDHKDCCKTHNWKGNLQWKTQKENTMLAYEKGLLDGHMGENCHLAKMDNVTAKKCCELLQEGKSTGEIAELLNVSKRSVQHIKDGHTWRKVSKNYQFYYIDRTPLKKTDEDIHKICKLIEEHKYNHAEIARMCGVSREYVRDIHNKKRRKDISYNYNF